MGRKNSKANSGVTLTELLIVVSIVGALALMAIVYLRSQVFKGNDGKRKEDVHKIQVAVEEYEKDHNCYPLPQIVICKPGGTGLQPYLEKIPCDPITKASYIYEVPGTNSCPSWYRIYVKLDNSADSDITKKSCQYGCGPNLAFNYYASSPNAPSVSGGTGPTPGPTTGPTGGGGPSITFYGCKSGACVPISWDASRPGQECDPNYPTSTCFGQCKDPNTGAPINECTPWK